MGNLLIKLGKAWSSARNDGVVQAASKAISAGASLLRPIPPGEVLFLSGGTGDSARYRTTHIAESLTIQGIRSSAAPQDSAFLFGQADRFRVFVFHRPVWTPRLEKFFSILKEKRKTIVFDTDDLVFDAELFRKTDAYRSMNALERKQYERGVGKEFLEDPFLAAITTSTAFLAERLRVFGKPVFVVPNRLSEEDIRIAERNSQLTTYNSQLTTHNSQLTTHNSQPTTSISQLQTTNCRLPTISIGYFSGTKTHDRDFATVAPVLLDLLGRYPNLSLFLAGPLALPVGFERYSSRIVRSPFVSRERHFENMAKVHINIAPLEIGDSFCESKSELKFFEAGAVGAPTVAAATRTFREAITDGVDGYVAASENEWREKLEKLILDTDFRKRMGESARETILGKYTTENAKDIEYHNFLRSRL